MTTFEHNGIIIKTAMVNATLEDRKRQTRRLNGLEDINKSPDAWSLVDQGGPLSEHGRGDDTPAIFVNEGTGDGRYIKPIWVPGDRLWVRETWATYKSLDHVKPSNLALGAPKRRK